MVAAGIGGINDYLKQEWLHRVHHPLLTRHLVATDMLRLDRIHPQVSGNKWLKLDFWLQKFREGSYKGIFTAGGPWSNHLHACAYACRLYGIEMHAMVKGYEGLTNPMLDDLTHWQVNYRFAGRNEFYNQEAQATYASGKGLMFIPMGGDGPEGVEGVTAFFNQLPLGSYDDVFCAVGTGTTLAGIAAGKHSFGRLNGCDPGTGDPTLGQRINTLQQNFPGKNICLQHSGKKMGQISAGLPEFMKEWFNHTGIPLDFVYTAPMAKMFLDMVSSGEMEAGKRVLLVHTGGLQGNRSVLPAKPT